MRALSIVSCLLLLNGCAGERSTRTDAPSASSTSSLAADERRILEVAKRSARERGCDLSDLEFYTPRRSSDGGWSVLVCSLPKMPGSFAIIHIDEHERVTRWDPGH